MKRPISPLVLLTCFGLATGLSAADAAKVVRNWTSSDGKAMQAELLEFNDKEIKVKLTSNFNIVKIPLERLSEADRSFIMDKVHLNQKNASMKEGPYAPQVQGKFVKAVSKLGLNFQFYGNPEWDGSKRYPLVIWLHGSGSSGTDNQAQMGGATGVFTNAENQSERPCFMLAPQCPDAAIGWKNEVAGKLMALIADLAEKLPIDPDRIYLTGSSMGGFGTWSLIAKYPNVFACAVPLCGGGDPKTAEIVKNTPVWAFHGDQDPMVPIERDRVMVAALKAINGNVQFTELTGEGHNISGIVYAKRDLHYWIFEQRRGSGASASTVK